MERIYSKDTKNIEVRKVDSGIYCINIQAPRLNKIPRYKPFFYFWRVNRHKHETITPEDLFRKICKEKIKTCR